jgi:hypothetical protein
MFNFCNKNNFYISKTIEITIQLLFIFLFLTLFFFIYVIKIEKNEFKHQMHYIIDNFMTELLTNNNININNIKNIDNIDIFINGFIEITKQKIKNDSDNIVKQVQLSNKKIINKAYSSIFFFILFIFFFILLLLFFGYCLNLKYDIKEAIIITIFIAITELTFLTIIASKYISANPNQVKRELTKNIMLWINNHKNI